MSARLRRAALGLAFLVLAWAALPTFRGWFAIRGAALLRIDYALYYASALQGLRMGWHRLYDLDAQRAVFQSISPDLWWFPNVYTPALSLMMAPFTRLSLGCGYAIWSAVLLVCAVLCWHWLAPGDRPLRGVQLAMLFVPYPVALGLWLGQVIVLQMAALALCYLLLQRGHDRAAGATLVVIALKPQGLFLVPFALLAAGRRRAFATWFASMAVVGALVLAVIGFDGALAYLDRLRYAQAHPEEFWVAWTYTLARRFEGPAKIAVLLAAAGLALVAAFRHRERPGLALAAGLIGSLLATPFLHLQDYMLMFPAGWLVLRAAPGRATVAVLLAGYVLLCLCHEQWAVWGRWLLLFNCLWLVALAALPAQWGRAREIAGS